MGQAVQGVYVRQTFISLQPCDRRLCRIDTLGQLLLSQPRCKTRRSVPSETRTVGPGVPRLRVHPVQVQVFDHPLPDRLDLCLRFLLRILREGVQQHRPLPSHSEVKDPMLHLSSGAQFPDLSFQTSHVRCASSRPKSHSVFRSNPTLAFSSGSRATIYSPLDSRSTPYYNIMQKG